MNPPGKRTAMPTVRCSNSTVKRWVITKLQLVASAPLAHGEPRNFTALPARFSGNAIAGLRCTLWLCALRARRRAGLRVVPYCCRDAALIAWIESDQSWLRYGTSNKFINRDSRATAAKIWNAALPSCYFSNNDTRTTSMIPMGIKNTPKCRRGGRKRFACAFLNASRRGRRSSSDNISATCRLGSRG